MMAEDIYEKFEKYNRDSDEIFKVCNPIYYTTWINMYFVANTQIGLDKLLNLKNIPHESTEAEILVAKYKYFYFSK